MLPCAWAQNAALSTVAMARPPLIRCSEKVDWDCPWTCPGCIARRYIQVCPVLCVRCIAKAVRRTGSRQEEREEHGLAS